MIYEANKILLSLCIFIFLHTFLFFSFGKASKEVNDILKVLPDKIIVSNYIFNKNLEYSLADIEIPDYQNTKQLLESEDVLYLRDDDSFDPRTLILSRGLGRIKEEKLNAFAKSLVENQQNAQEAQLGIWTKPTLFDSIKRSICTDYKYYIALFATIAGAAYPLFKKKKKKIIEKKEVLVLGMKNVGKTELSNRLDFQKGPSDGQTVKVIPHNLGVIDDKFNIRLQDTPGHFPGETYNLLKNNRSKNVVIFVLSPYNGAKENMINKSFIDKQESAVLYQLSAYLTSEDGCLCEGVIIFLNMFDKFSDYKLDDPKVEPKIQEFTALFKSHIDQIKSDISGIKNRKPTFRILVGSSKLGWNVDVVGKLINTILCTSRSSL